MSRRGHRDFDLAGRVRALRRGLGLSQAAFAELIGVDEDLIGMSCASEIHVLDAEQGEGAWRDIPGRHGGARDLAALNRRDFYFEKFFKGRVPDSGG